MKKIAVYFLVVLVGYAPVSMAQENEKTAKKKAGQKTQASLQKGMTADTVTLTSGSSNAAFGTATSSTLTIADPTVNALRRQAAGSSSIVSPSGIVGMPKRAYGFSNGKLLLRKTTALSSGTLYGSGAVGTGTSIFGAGTGENVIGVNGKNPYAGPSLWGSKIPNRNLPLADSTQQRP